MANKKKPADHPKTLVEKVADAVDHLIHPDAPVQPEADASDAPAVEKETDPAPAAEQVESGMQDHKKFDKFK